MRTGPLPKTTKLRRYPIGAEVTANGVDFRVWASSQKKVEVVLESGISYPLQAEPEGYFSASLPVAAGAKYKFRLGTDLFPDPVSRFQPEGPFGWSQVVDPTFPWTDKNWKGCKLAGQVIYEMHIGTFTKEGTWTAAAAQLAELATLGITVIEVMPVADFDGSFGWGYDGVDFFAPTRLYGTPDDFRNFVDDAHALGMGVILDVVYNHAGPSGNFLGTFSPSYFTDRYITDWGAAINYDGKESAPVREFVTTNAAYWIDEYHLDGLRVDATQNIYDSGPVHILQDLATAARNSSTGRDIIVVAENEPQDTKLLRSYGFDGMWNDDFHHSAMVAIHGHDEAYYTDYSGRAQEFVSAFKHGFLYQGQYYSWQKQPRGTSSLHLDPSAFVVFLQNHDQVANSMRGHRMDRLASPARCRAMTTMLLLAPNTPMLFQGQEFASSAPFTFFSDHSPEIAKLVAAGRSEFTEQFRSYGKATERVTLPDTSDPKNFQRCKLDFAGRERNSETYLLHKDLLHLRKIAFQSMRDVKFDGAVLGDRTLLIRYFADDGNDLVLIVNLDMDLHLKSIPEPLLAPPAGSKWHVMFSSEHPQYGGSGIYLPDADGHWNIPADSAMVLGPQAE